MTNETNRPHRDPRLDILRGIGLLCIILSHVGPPGFIFQLRNFDVPLMVLVSGASFSLSRAQDEKYGPYLFSRFNRLVVPTWVFLTFFFGVTLLASLAAKRPFPFSAEKVLSSFALLGGIGYVWVIRVFFLVALIAPLAKTILSSNRLTLFWLFVGLCYMIYEFAVHYFPWSNMEWLDVIFKEFVFCAVPYGLVMAIGMTMHQLNIQRRFIYAAILLLMFACIAGWFHIVTGGFVPTQRYKYPPTFYYLSYAVGVSLAVSGIVELLHIDSIFLGRLLAWIGKRSMWTYLWHIFILYLLGWIHLNSNFIILFLLVSMAALSIVVIQEKTLKAVLSKVVNERTREQMLLIFSG